MAGILDPKQRVMDVVITEIGREQMRKGQFEVKYASFSDRLVEYKTDENGVLIDFDGFTIEAYSEIADEIVPEVDNNGLFTLTQPIAEGIEVNNEGTVVDIKRDPNYPVDAFGNIDIDGTEIPIIDQYSYMSKSRLEQLKILQTTQSVDDFDDTNVMAVLEYEPNQNNSLDSLDYFIQDPRMVTQLTLKRLPPVNMINNREIPLDVYNELMESKTTVQLLQEIKNSESTKFEMEIDLGPNQTDYDIIGQIFMKKDSKIKKLLILDAGAIKDEFGKDKQKLYYCGLIFKDEQGGTKFSNTCSIVFSKSEVN